MRLLLIEDNSALRNAVSQYFREAGFIVETAATGDEGLWAACENPCDVILLDLMLILLTIPVMLLIWHT